MEGSFVQHTVKYKCKNVTHADSISRQMLIKWVNELLKTDYKKVEELCTGTSYCEMMNILFPGSVNIKKVQQGQMTHFYRTNFIELQNVFKSIGCDKIIPTDSLIQGRYSDNFEFLSWFKTFFEANAIDDAKRSVKKTSSETVSQPGTSMCNPSTFEKSNIRNIKMELENYKKREEELKVERDFYYNKLRKIEILITEAGKDKEENVLVSRILKKLYEKEEGFASPAEKEEDDDDDEII